MSNSPWSTAQHKAEQMRQRKQGKPIAMFTAYDYPTAKILDEAGADALLVGDSLGMVVMGYTDTTQVTLADMLHHTRMVTRATPAAFVIADMPINTYRTIEEALDTARQLMETGADAVKLEGGEDVVPQVTALSQAGIPVVGHIGLLPQRIKEDGGYKLKGKTEAEITQLKKDIIAIAHAGCCLIVIEGTKSPVARQLTDLISIPTIGIGSGANTCDGAVVVISDLVGAYPWFVPSFVKPRADVAGIIRHAAQQWIVEIRHTTT